jgi:glucose uptake protein
MGSFYPLVEMSKSGDFGLRAYSVGFIFALGVFLSTPVFNLVFMNVPVAGEPVRFGEYFRGTFRQHLLGVVGGVIWAVGAANFAAASARRRPGRPRHQLRDRAGRSLVSTPGACSTGRSSKERDRRSILLTVMIIAFVIGLGLISITLFA